MTEKTGTGETGCWRHEVRFGVVMYGGVSLAVYINGVVQELLSLVRATAPDADGSAELVDGPLRIADEHLSPIERVYRDLGRVSAPDEPASLDGPVRTRFVVDIISGSSAGGINGVYLAKALTQNQSITALKNLWIDRAGFSNILNDRTGRGERRDALTDPEPTESLFSGDRMYVELLDALDGMDNEAESEAREHGSTPEARSMVGDLDLWLTATDLEGIVEPLHLADQTIPERRHRHVFHFSHGQDQIRDGRLDHFTSAENPILAFAARATSSFPFAFAPARLVDIERVLRTKHEPRGRSKAKDPAWRPWFSRYQSIFGDADAHTRVSFGDGGDMDNKPFGWVIDTLPSRTSTAPVDRRLLYVEPDPGDALQAIEPAPRPDPVASVIAAVSLGRVEQIRDEVERLSRRSETLRQIAAAASELHARFRADETALDPTTTADWLTEPPEDMLARGAAYQTYYRLRIEALIAEFGRSLSHLGWSEPSTTAADALRSLTRRWVESSYRDPFRSAEAPTTKTLLRDYDIAFRVRRLAFAAHWADLDHRTVGVVVTDDAGEPVPSEAFRAELRRIKQGLGRAEQLLRRHVPSARANWGDNDVPAFPLSQLDLDAYTSDPDSWLDATWATRRDEWTRTVSDIADFLSTPSDHSPSVFKRASTIVAQTLDPYREVDVPAPDELRARRVARERIGFVYRRFGNFDQVMFPIQLAAGGGEIDPVDVYRISPQDADSLVDPTQNAKVAGARFFHFGGFLDPAWRANDIMWGRLDAAERLITTLAPEEHRAALLERAHDAILQEEWFREGRRGHSEAPQVTGTSDSDRRWRLDQFRTTFSLPEWPAQSSLLRLAARASQVTADVLEGAADLPGAKPVHRLVAGLAWVLTAASTVLFPGGAKRSPIRALCVAAVAIGVVFVLAGTVFGWETGTDAGRVSTAVGVTGLVAILLTRLGWRRPVRLVVAGAIGLVLALAVIGGRDLDGDDLRFAAAFAGLSVGVGVIGIVRAALRSVPLAVDRLRRFLRARRAG